MNILKGHILRWQVLRPSKTSCLLVSLLVKGHCVLTPRIENGEDVKFNVSAGSFSQRSFRLKIPFMAEYFTTILELGKRKGQGREREKMEGERELPLPTNR